LEYGIADIFILPLIAFVTDFNILPVHGQPFKKILVPVRSKNGSVIVFQKIAKHKRIRVTATWYKRTVVINVEPGRIVVFWIGKLAYTIGNGIGVLAGHLGLGSKGHDTEFGCPAKGMQNTFPSFSAFLARAYRPGSQVHFNAIPITQSFNLFQKKNQFLPLRTLSVILIRFWRSITVATYIQLAKNFAPQNLFHNDFVVDLGVCGYFNLCAFESEKRFRRYHFGKFRMQEWFAAIKEPEPFGSAYVYVGRYLL
jgi:hypothetical protein